jgi:glycosyltransferase involved in cell wall biosynthesis
MVLPYCPRLDAAHGGKTVAELILRLGDGHRLAVIHLRRPGEETADAEIRRRCEAIEDVILTPPDALRHRAARVWGLLGAVGRGGRPLQVTDFASSELGRRLLELVLRWRPDVVHVELEAMAQYLPLLHDLPPRRVLVLVEPAAQTADEVYAASSGLERWVRLLDRRAWRAFERRVAGEADGVVVLTERDRRYAAVVAGPAPVFTIPLGVAIPPRALDPAGGAPPSVVFVGGFGHAPNVEAASRLAEKILPRILARKPATLLYLVGDKPPARLRALSRDNVIVTGRVADVAEYLERAAVVVAPLDVGGGMRLKVLETLAAGKALVATPRALEGVAVEDREHVLVADADAAFADAVLKLLESSEERARMGRAARAWSELHLSPDVSAAAYKRVYEELLARPARRRP